MNRNKIKAYAPQARREFIRAVTERAALYGLTKEKTERVVEQGDVAVIGGRPYPRTVAALRKRLEERVGHEGFDHVMEAMAYTWFNRLVAIRYMELHEFLDHGFRVLSHPEGRNTPQLLEHAEEVDLPGLKRETVIDLKLAGNREAELYRTLLIAQCNALHDAMPFLFERIDDETELLLPDNLLQTDSIVRTLVAGIDEEDWQEVEIIGWLYQFYIAEKKDEVIGKVVASEDIPAATQLFTPNWIVKYLVQNTLGRQWLATYPQSALRQNMEYYIEPAEQTPEVQEHIKAITPTSLSPEALTLLDPACGSGHILVEAYDLFKAIYQERGYRSKDIPALILQKNLFGFEIDDRAAQLAAFALTMKARADDRRLFDQKVQPLVLALIQTDDMDAEEIAAALNIQKFKETPPPGALFETEDNLFTRAASAATASQVICLSDVTMLVDLFENAKKFGSLLNVPTVLCSRLPQIERRCREVARETGQITSRTAAKFLPVIEQAKSLAAQYDCVVANPPYMGTRYMNAFVKDFARQHFPDNKADLFSVCIERYLNFTKAEALCGFMTPFTWMFIKSYEALRSLLTTKSTIRSLIRPEYHAFFESAYIPICAFTVQKSAMPSFRGSYIDLTEFYGETVQPVKALEAISDPDCHWKYTSSGQDYSCIPGRPIAYWISERMRECFREGTPLGDIAPAKHGMSTGNNHRFLRCWYETCHFKIGIAIPSRDAAAESGKKWFPYNKGGEYRRWYGNNTFVVNYEDRGRDMRAACEDGSNTGFRHDNYTLYFLPSLTWTDISSTFFAVRCSDPGFVFDAAGSSAFPCVEWRESIAGFMASKITSTMLAVLNPTMHFQVGNIRSLPVLQPEILAHRSAISRVVREAVQLARTDWDSCEVSWDFVSLPLLNRTLPTIEESVRAANLDALANIQRMKELEEENNRLFIEAYGLQAELSPEVPDDQITLHHPNREEDIRRLISYALGCTMGRYSLEKPGLVYAHGGNVAFDPSQYRRFPADPDGIVPVTDTACFADDATNRFIEFVGVAWPKDHLEDNLKFVAESLAPNRDESPRGTVRRYLATGFYKHHLQVYKRRPIYWLFSSGKQRAFQCLVYMHRYNEGTLSRMRTEYVIPLQGLIASRIEHLAGDIAAATSTAQRKKLEKERETLLKQQAELHSFDEKLRHVADTKITLDLDDGAKVNYGKFGDLLADVKAVTGGTEEE
jgi:hypothetical protein